MEEQELNLGEYTYKEGVNVEIPGGTLIALLNHLNMVANQETKVAFNIDQEGIPDVKTPITQTTPLGATSIGILPLLEQAHINAIKTGVSTHVSEVQQKSAFTEVTEEGKEEPKGESGAKVNTEVKEEKKGKTTMKVTK